MNLNVARELAEKAVRILIEANVEQQPVADRYALLVRGALEAHDFGDLAKDIKDAHRNMFVNGLRESFTVDGGG
jgi:hypothetical protein